MSDQFQKYNFVKTKLIVCFSMFIYLVSNKVQSFNPFRIEWLLVAVFIFATSGYELSEKKNIWLAVEIIISILLFVLFKIKTIDSVCIVIACLDAILLTTKSISYGLLVYIVLLFDIKNTILLALICTILLCLYYQNYSVIYRYHKYVEKSRKEEFNLKESIDMQQKSLMEEKKRERLYAENKILEERDQLFQQLHDKLGHSINGSVYQLEAAKVLLDKKPKESEKILQAVIDNLRTSMDELRRIFRKEKPSKSQMAIVQLIELCKKCKDEYSIEAEFNLEGDGSKISNEIYEVILDNTYEAVTNALKYSQCTKITIRIRVMNQLVQCIITDNGHGCSNIEEGMGIQGMKKRMRMIGGVFMIQSEVGFEIKMLFPM